MRVVEFFAGLGGLRLALTRAEAGYDVVSAVEQDPGKVACYRAHFPDGALVQGDAFVDFRPPIADLWVACAAPKLLAHLLSIPGRNIPPRLWLQTVPQDTSMLRLDGYARTDVVCNGRIHILLVRTVTLDIRDLGNDTKIHQPDARYMKADRPYVMTVEEAEEAQGFPRGWTAMPGVDEQTRRTWLAASEHVPSCTAIARRIAEAG